MTKYITQKKDLLRRIDQLVLDIFPEITRSTSKELVMQGIIKVNGKQVRSNYRINEGDHIDYSTENVTRFIGKNVNSSIKARKMDLKIIFEDEFTIVLNKETGVTTHPVPGHREDTLLNGLVYYQQNKKNDSSDVGESTKIRPVHRLDKDTSGVILFAKSRDAQAFYSDQFEKGNVQKTYLAVVKGNFNNFLRQQGKDEVFIQNYLKRSKKEKKKMIVTSNNNGELAISFISYVDRWRGKKGDYSIVKIQPKTGRTHQIRVHLSELGFPIVGDILYDGENYKRLMLHSSSLLIVDFKSKKSKEFSADLPREFLLESF